MLFRLPSRPMRITRSPGIISPSTQLDGPEINSSETVSKSLAVQILPGEEFSRHAAPSAMLGAAAAMLAANSIWKRYFCTFITCPWFGECAQRVNISSSYRHHGN
uniref:Uncharacterized protein n=1 Tax=uncultured marine bacterium 463 TaxID=257394 RepID=Q6SGU7_9BACT|nr:hypothetical protein MBMO_EBAC080-L32B05.13 [uncultured marine bacterium 463]